MKWTFHPENEELTTSLPMSVEIREFKGKPEVLIREIGSLELKKMKEGGLRSEFYVSLPGKYVLEVRDAERFFQRELEIKQHVYLKFNKEFGSFSIIFLFVMGGVVLWTRRIMKNKIS